MSRELFDIPPNHIVSLTGPDSVKNTKFLTDPEAMMAIMHPEAFFRGFSRTRELDQHIATRPTDNWENRWGRRTALLCGRTELDGEEFTTQIVITEPNIIGRGLMCLLKAGKIATAHIERGVDRAPRRDKTLAA